MRGVVQVAVLVCGGAGYIGSHAVHQLVAKGEAVVIVDNLQTGHRGALHPEAKFYEGDIREAAVLDRIFTENEIEAVIHFAANSLVGESMEKPLKYFNNNVYGMQVLLEAMVRHGVDKIVFSSTAAVYGEPRRVPIMEDDETELILERDEATDETAAAQLTVELQQKQARVTDVVMDGRDIGTVVLPEADLKIYLTAGSRVRAERRYKEMIEKGMECDLDTIEEEIKERDHRDMTRENSPLKKADDAVEIDSSYMTIDEVADKIIELYRSKQ